MEYATKTPAAKKPDIFAGLIRILREQNEALEKLRQNLRQQYRNLLDANLKDFVATLEQQQALIWEVEQWDSLRADLLERNFPGESPLTLTELAAKAPPGYRDRLEDLKRQFGEKIADVRRLRETNLTLIRKSLETVDLQIQGVEALLRIGYDEKGKSDRPELSAINRRV